MNFSLIDENRKHFGIFEPFVEQTLGEISYAQYYFDGERIEGDVGTVEFDFLLENKLLLSLAPNGESVEASTGKLQIQEGFELCEGGYCEWKRESIDNGFIGRRLLAVDALVDQLSNSSPFTGSWLFHFESAFLVYHNCGDDAQILVNNLPPTHQTITTRTVRVAPSMA